MENHIGPHGCCGCDGGDDRVDTIDTGSALSKVQEGDAKTCKTLF